MLDVPSCCMMAPERSEGAKAELGQGAAGKLLQGKFSYKICSLDKRYFWQVKSYANDLSVGSCSP
jgi:hypothetical protein